MDMERRKLMKLKVKHPAYVMMSSDYSQQEPKLTAFCANEPRMIQSFVDGKDIYATLSSVAYHMPYEDCLEFHPETHEYQPEGKQRRGVGKVLVLGRPSRLKILPVTENLCPLNRSLTIQTIE